jgi:hypothetical protein
MRLHELNLLLEGQNYELMFKQIFDMLQMSRDRHLQADIHRMINKVRLAFKRNDRIVWFLRLYRIMFLTQMTGDYASARLGDRANEDMVAAAKALRDAYINDLAQRSNVAPRSIQSMLSSLTGTDYLFRHLEHYFSLPIAAIQNYGFAYQPIGLVLDQFGQFEQAWQRENRGQFAANQVEGAEVLIDFHNGFAWYNLNKAYCPLEAKAAGHCGNEPRANSGDRIISLRQSVNKGGHAFLKPYCTFILLEDGTLGEMKGRFNQSPKNAFKKGDAPSDFHNEIAALLRLPLIQGITGGGYMPEQNFKLSDLPKALADTLAQEKPALLSPREEYDRFGMSDHLAQRLINQADLAGHDISYLSDQKGFTVERFRNLRDFIDEFVTIGRNKRMATAAWVADVLDGNSDLDISEGADDYGKEAILGEYKKRYREQYNALHHHVAAMWREDNGLEDDDNDLPPLLNMIQNVADDIDSLLDQACYDAMESGAQDEMSKSMQRWVDDLKSPGREFWIAMPDDHYLDGAVTLILSPEKIMEWADEYFDSRLKDLIEVNDIDEPYYGFRGFDEEAGVERFADAVSDEIDLPVE